VSIPRLSSQLRKYIQHFDVAAVIRYEDGRIGVSRDPQGAVEAHWLQADHAGAVLKLAGSLGDIRAAASKAGVHMTEHSVMAQRAQASVERLDERPAKAKGDGLITFFNSQYRQQRLAARAEGHGFMSYRTAELRLRKALVDVAAGDSAPIIKRVFGGG